MQGAEAVRGFQAPEPTPITVSDALDRFFNIRSQKRPGKRSGWCPKRQENSRRIFEAWLAILPPVPLKDITSMHIEELYEARNDGTRGGSTLNGERVLLRSFFLWAGRHRLISVDPSWAWEPQPEKIQRVYQAIEPDLEEKLLESLELTDAGDFWWGRTKRSARAAVGMLLVIAIRMGLRLGLIYKARWEWISRDWFLTVPGTEMKNGEPLRLPVPRKVVEILGPRGEPQDLLIPGLPPASGTVNRIMKRAARRCGVDEKTIYPHQCRRTMVGRLLEAGINDVYIQKLGQWHQAEVMRRHYTCGIKDQLARDILDKI
jgi:integrase